MRFHPKKGLVATALALALGSFGAAHAADTIIFDPDGTALTNGDTSVGAFDWAVASALSDQANASPSDFDLYFHAALSGFQDTGGNPAGSPTGLNTSFEITVIGGFSEAITVTGTTTNLSSTGGDGLGGGNDVYTFTTTATLSLTSPTGSFLQIYYDDLTDGSGLKSDALLGTGYGDGLLILDATVASSTGTIAVSQQFIDVDNSGTFTAGDTVLSVNLDNFGDNDWLGILSATADGSTSLTADIFYQDFNFFKTLISALTQDVDFTTETTLNFDQTNPSQSFDDGAGGVIALGGLLNVGTCNACILPTPGTSGQGPDVLLQADASNSFTSSVPEPNVLGLLGLGLVGLAMFRRRQEVI